MYVIGVFDDPNKDLEHIKIEKDHFQNIMGKLQMGEDFKYEIFEGNSLESLMDKIDEMQDILTWFHFSGHHDKGGIQLNDGNFSSLVEHLKNCKNLKGVFINGCASESTLENLKNIVPICIGTNKPVNDGLATKFSEKFYQKMTKIANWNDYVKIHKAFELTKTQINDLLNTKEGIDGIDFTVRGGGSLKEMELEDNFYFISSESEENKNLFDQIDPDIKNYVFNQVLTKQLIDEIKLKSSVAAFLKKVASGNEDQWELKPENLKNAQGVLEDSFVWVIGSELRRLFAIGADKQSDAKAKTEDYMTHCFSTYRISLQLINYLFISILWDEKTKNPKIDTDKALIRDFFCANRNLKLVELRNLFQLLIEIFKSNKLDFPIEEDHLGDVKMYLDSDSKFNKACSSLESLEDSVNGIYELSDCRNAEMALAGFLTGFNFFANYKLVTIKRIEYEESRNSAAKYIKDITILEKKETENLIRVLKYDNSPALTYSVIFRNKNKAINLFPFLLDFNALINAAGFQLYFYQSSNGKSGINYYSLKSEEEKTIFYKAAAAKTVEQIEDEDKKNRLQKKIRLDLVTKQFEEAMNTLLGTNFKFEPQEDEMIAEDLINI